MHEYKGCTIAVNFSNQLILILEGESSENTPLSERLNGDGMLYDLGGVFVPENVKNLDKGMYIADIGIMDGDENTYFKNIINVNTKLMGVEAETQIRVDFKMNEFNTAMQNRIKTHSNAAYHLAFGGDIAMSQKHTYVKEAYEEFLQAFEKERRMAVPSNDMFVNKLRLQKDAAMQIAEKYFTQKYRGSREYDSIMNNIVTIVETAQRNLL